jgi:type 1 fimbria pilin
MIEMTRTVRRHLPRAAILATLWHPAAAFAANGGCYHSADGYYQIGQTAQIVVSNDMAPGTVVRDEKAHGDGNVLATCIEGVATFEGDYSAVTIDSLVPLTVGGRPSGFGVELYIEELLDGTTFPFPHRYQRNFKLGDPVRSNHANIGYRIKRMTGPVEFGAFDRVTIGQQWTVQPNGARTKPFRHMAIYDLTLVRPACSIVVDDLNQTVKLGPYNASNFATPDRATPWVAFNLRVEQCQEPVGLVAQFTFGTKADGVAGQPDLFSLEGPTNVGLELGDEYKRNVSPGVPSRLNALGSGKAYTFHARLRETQATVRGGMFSRAVNVLVEFR